jgi:hypothetical protein
VIVELERKDQKVPSEENKEEKQRQSYTGAGGAGRMKET